MRNLTIAPILLLMFCSTALHAQQVTDSTESRDELLMKLIKSSKVETQIFFGYRYDEQGKNNSNEFMVKRGYVTFKKKLNEHITGRLTPDITVDREGDGTGDLEMRLKYCYVDIHDDGDYWIFSKPSVLLGEVFTPWLNFEEKIYGYRVQGPQFIDYTKVITSADFGITAMALLGGEVSKEYQKNVSNKYPGKYGSVAVGIYNGGGYHALEYNNNKAVEWRLTLRPFPESVTGLQLTYTGAYGKGNKDYYPDWHVNAGAVTYQSRRFVSMVQGHSSLGNYSGSLSDAGKSYTSKGWSAFAEYKFFKGKFSLFGRYDYNRIERTAATQELSQKIIGVAYHLYKKNKLVIDYNNQEVDGEHNGVVQVMFELSL